MNIEQMVDDYIELPIGQLSITGSQCGRFKMAKVTIDGREAVLDFFKRPCRNQAIKNGIRYSEPLPVCTPARSLSIEIAELPGRHASAGHAAEDCRCDTPARWASCFSRAATSMRRAWMPAHPPALGVVALGAEKPHVRPGPSAAALR